LIRHTPGNTLSEGDSKTLLAAYGIPVARALPARSAEEAVQVATQIGFPVAVKILSPQITHKTDAGGVALDVRNTEGVRLAFEQVTSAAKKHDPDAEIQGVTIQRMYDASSGVELIAGMKQDATFGAVLMVGAGGIQAELFQDRSLELPPLNERLAQRMLDSLKIKKLLDGYRGRTPVNQEQLIESLIRLSYLVADNPEIQELDVNPLLVTPDGVVALDARVILRQDSKEVPRPYSHLAIRPYPEEFVRPMKLSDGTPILFRPIRPEDIPQWLEMLEACSTETLHSRFRYLFRTATHEMAARYCFLDYDRELAIVAEQEQAGRRRFLGIGRVTATPQHEAAEYAVLVIDEWQNRGLGSQLTAHCLEIARQWGIRTITAETGYENRRMVSLFEQFGFKVSFANPGNSGGTITARLESVP
jgi:acetyltransferase